MNRVLRACLVWIMVLAMPLQGMAAATMRVCGPSHERMMLLLAGGAGHPCEEGGALAHGAAAQGEAVAGHGHAHDHAQAADGSGTLSGHGKHSCSACAVCGLTAALPAGLSLPPAIGPALPLQVAPPSAVPTHHPDGLDRPPRPHHA